MKFSICLDNTHQIYGVQVGNCYNVRGGRGAKLGHIFVVVAITDGLCTCLVVNKEGDIVGGTNYYSSYFEDKIPIAFAEGIDEINLRMTSL
jgi:hypothetical protein